jgi:hypothetical protein
MYMVQCLIELVRLWHGCRDSSSRKRWNNILFGHLVYLVPSWYMYKEVACLIHWPEVNESERLAFWLEIRHTFLKFLRLPLNFNDWLLPKAQPAVFRTITSSYIETLEKWGKDGLATFDCHSKDKESWVGTKTKAAIMRLLFFRNLH